MSDMVCSICELPINGTWHQDFLSDDIWHDCCMDQGEEPCEHFRESGT